MNIFMALLRNFLKIGLFTFGGGLCYDSLLRGGIKI